MVGSILGWVLGWVLRLTIGTVLEIVNPKSNDYKCSGAWLIILVIGITIWFLKVNLL